MIKDTQSGEITPRPDPTALTTQAVTLAIATVKDLFKSELDAVKDVLNEKLSSLKEQVKADAAANTKTFDAMTAINRTNYASLNEKIEALKERVTASEAMIRGREVARTSGQATGQYIIAIIGIVVGTLIGAAGLFVALFSK